MAMCGRVDEANHLGNSLTCSQSADKVTLLSQYAGQYAHMHVHTCALVTINHRLGDLQLVCISHTHTKECWHIHLPDDFILPVFVRIN